MTLPDEVKQAMKAAMREAWRGNMALEPLNEDEAGAYLDAALSALSSAGYAVVPRVATEEMIEAGNEADYVSDEGISLERTIRREGIAAVWTAMLSAAENTTP